MKNNLANVLKVNQLCLALKVLFDYKKGNIKYQGNIFMLKSVLLHTHF